MDVYCPLCGEPWDTAEFHDARMPYLQAVRAFRKIGCAVFSTRCNEAVNAEKADRAKAVFSVVGDDLDGAASEMDFE